MVDEQQRLPNDLTAAISCWGSAYACIGAGLLGWLVVTLAIVFA